MTQAAANQSNVSFLSSNQAAPAKKHVVESAGVSGVLNNLHAATSQYIDSKKNKNTLRSIECSKNKFQSYIIEKGITKDMLDLDRPELDQFIGAWILDMKKDDGSEYEPTTITANVNRLARHISDKKSVDILDKNLFPIAHNVLLAKKKDLKQQGKGNTPNKAEILEECDEMKLWESGALGYNNPQSLLHTVWFHTTKLLGFRGCNEARQLKWGDFRVVKDESGENIDFIEWNERSTKTRQGTEDENSRSFTPKMWPNLDDPLKCPIVAFKLYESKRPKDMLNPDSPFYLTINHGAKLSDNTCNWYKNCPMGKNCIGSIMKKNG